MNGPLTIARPAVSVVIVSRDRPEALKRCLLGVSQLIYDPFEVVVVADPAGCAALRPLPLASQVKLLPFDEANISAARNRGTEAAAGDIIAFIDDDAVPEPTWLHALTAPFARADVSAAGGFVRGRNGISWQSTSQMVDYLGQTAPLVIKPGKTTILTGARGRAIKTEGTNMALRRSVLARLGGFDTRYRYFLDETDLNLRLARTGARTALVPDAEVHHGFAASSRRRSDRVPRDLTEIGASWAVFLNSHCPEPLRNRRWLEIRQAERTRAISHMLRGGLEPRDVRRLMHSLEDGFADGLKRPIPEMPPLSTASEPFLPMPRHGKGVSVCIAGRSWSKSRLNSKAKTEVASGRVVTVMRYSPTALFHRVTFVEEGYWLQTGGLFGKSNRSDPPFRWRSFSARVKSESERIAGVRGLDFADR